MFVLISRAIRESFNKKTIFFCDKCHTGSDPPPCFVTKNYWPFLVNKHCKILVSCSDEERNCIQALAIVCKNGMQAYVTACELMLLHASLCNCMQTYVTACKLMLQHTHSVTTCKLMDLHESSCNALEPLGTFVQTLYRLVETCTNL